MQLIARLMKIKRLVNKNNKGGSFYFRAKDFGSKGMLPTNHQLLNFFLPLALYFRLFIRVWDFGCKGMLSTNHRLLFFYLLCRLCFSAA